MFTHIKMEIRLDSTIFRLVERSFKFCINCVYWKRDFQLRIISFLKKAANITKRYIISSAYASSEALNYTTESITKKAIWIFESYAFIVWEICYFFFNRTFVLMICFITWQCKITIWWDVLFKAIGIVPMVFMIIEKLCLCKTNQPSLYCLRKLI